MEDLTKANELHNLAMEYADEAIFAKRKGEEDKAKQYFEKAFLAEKCAAEQVAGTNLEPTRSVLHRSAATLALDCGEIREAEKLISVALSGEPPFEIAEELRDLQERVQFERHLELRGITLEDQQLQVSFAGKAVGAGIALHDAVFTRVAVFEKLVIRTTERLLDYTYSEKTSIPNPFGLYISAPRAGSFSLTLHIGYGAPPRLTNFGDDKQVIDELMKCMRLLQDGKMKKLNERIPDPAYFRNFVGLAKQIAPDGDDISMVGLTSVRSGQEIKVSLYLHQEDIPELSKPESADPEITILDEKRNVSGELLYADALKGDKIVKLKDSDSKTWRIFVSKELMEDIVRPYWGRIVKVHGYKVKKKNILGNTLHLIDISPAESQAVSDLDADS